MKKTLFIVAIAGMAFLVSCGTGTDKAGADTKKNDSIAAAKRSDSLAMAAKKQHMDDSIKNAAPKADTVKAAGDKKEEKK